jgi:iron complex transport system ATP-binding protein
MTVMRLSAIDVVRETRPILERVSLSVASGEVLGIVGPNGAGKSTLLRVMAGLLAPAAGTVELDGRDLRSWNRNGIARRIAYLPQHPECHWAMAAERVVALGRLPHIAPWQRPRAEDRHAIQAAMAATDVTHLARRSAGTLSGGEHARVMLARALAAEPALLLADEPVADLDPYHSIDVMDHLAGLARAGRAVAVVLHDLTLATRYCDRLALLDCGRIVAEGPAEPTLSTENLAGVYRVAALRGRHEGKPYLLPWTRLPERPEPS